MWGCCLRQEEDGQRLREGGEIRRALGREESLVTWVECGDGSDTGGGQTGGYRKLGRFEAAEGSWETKKLGEFGRQGENLNRADAKAGSRGGRGELVRIEGKPQW